MCIYIVTISNGKVRYTYELIRYMIDCFVSFLFAVHRHFRPGFSSRKLPMRVQTRFLLPGHEIGQEVLQWHGRRGRIREINDGKWFIKLYTELPSAFLHSSEQLCRLMIRINVFNIQEFPVCNNNDFYYRN